MCDSVEEEALLPHDENFALNNQPEPNESFRPRKKEETKEKSSLTVFFEEQILHNVRNQLIIIFLVIVLIMGCIKIQYVHQANILKERLPTAHFRLWEGILVEERTIQKKIANEQQLALKALLDVRGKKAKHFDLNEFDKHIEQGIQKGKQIEERIGNIDKKQKILAKGLNMHMIITEAMIQEKKKKKQREKNRYAAEHPECQPGDSPLPKQKDEKKKNGSLSPTKDKFGSEQKADIKDTSEHSAQTGNKHVSAEPLSAAAKPPVRDIQQKRSYLRKAESQEYSMNQKLGGVIGLKNKNANQTRNKIPRNTNRDSNSEIISELSGDGERKENSSKARVSFNTSAWPDDRSEKRVVAKNIKEQIKHLSQTQGLMSIDQIKLKSDKDKETEAGGGASEGTEKRTGGKLSYWDKVNIKKLRQKKVKTTSKPKGSARKDKKSKDTGSKSAKESTYSSGSEVQVKVRDKDDPQFIFTVGNASQVGERPGEHPYQPVVFDVDTEDKSLVSIFCRKHNLRPDSHMKIIVQHQQEIIKEVLGNRIKERMGQVNRRLNQESCYRRMLNCCSETGTYFGFNQQEIYINKYPIDLYIDRYWLTNCPSTMSVGDINDQVYNLIHQLILVTEESDLRPEPNLYGPQSLSASGTKIKIGGANIMEDSALMGLKYTQSQMGDESRQMDSSFVRSNPDTAERRDVVNKLSTQQSNQFINIEDQQNGKLPVDPSLNVLNLRNINSEQRKVRQPKPKSHFMHERSSKTTMNRWYPKQEDPAKSPTKFKRTGMKVVKKSSNPDGLGGELGEDDKYSRAKSQQTRRQRQSMDFQSQSQGQLEAKSFAGNSMTKADDQMASNASIKDSASKTPLRPGNDSGARKDNAQGSVLNIPTVPRFRKRDSQNLSRVELRDTIQNQQNPQAIYNEITRGYELVRNKGSQLQKTQNLLEHQGLIQAIMIAIKPKLSHMLCKRYTSTMIKSYFAVVRGEQRELQKKEEERLGINPKQITVEPAGGGASQLLNFLKTGPRAPSSDIKTHAGETSALKETVDIESRNENLELKIDQWPAYKTGTIHTMSELNPNIKTSLPSHHSQNDIMESNQDDDNDQRRTAMGQATIKKNNINDVGIVNGNASMNLLEATRTHAMLKEAAVKEAPKIQLSPTVKDIQKNYQTKDEQKAPENPPIVNQDIEMLQFNHYDANDAYEENKPSQEKTPLFNQVQHDFSDQVEYVVLKTHQDQEDQDMAPSQVVVDEVTPSGQENGSELPQFQESPKMKYAVDAKAYTTPLVNQLIEEEVQLQKEIAQKEEQEKLDQFDIESQNLQISNDSFQDLQQSIEKKNQDTNKYNDRLSAGYSLNIMDDLAFDDVAANTAKFNVIEKASRNTQQKTGDSIKFPADYQRPFNKQSINTHMEPDNKSEAINFGKIASSTRKVDAKKTNANAVFSLTTSGFNKLSAKQINHLCDATFESIESDPSLRQLDRRNYENLDDVQSDKQQEKMNRPFLAANKADTDFNEQQEATLHTSTGRHGGGAPPSQSRSMSLSNSRSLIPRNAVQSYEAHPTNNQYNQGYQNQNKNAAPANKAPFGSINVPIGVMGSIVQQSKGLGLKHNKRGGSKKRQHPQNNRQVYTLENNDSILQYQQNQNLQRGIRPSNIGIKR